MSLREGLTVIRTDSNHVGAVELDSLSPLVKLFEKAQELFTVPPEMSGLNSGSPAGSSISNSSGTPELSSNEDEESSNEEIHYRGVESNRTEIDKMMPVMPYGYNAFLPPPPHQAYNFYQNQQFVAQNYQIPYYAQGMNLNLDLPPLQAHQFHSTTAQQHVPLYSVPSYPASFEANGGTYHFIPNTVPTAIPAQEQELDGGKKKKMVVKKVQKKRFICPQSDCGRAFARNFNMQSHIKAHLGIRDFDCLSKLGCQKSFSRKHDRSRHMLAVHADEVNEEEEE